MEFEGVGRAGDGSGGKREGTEGGGESHGDAYPGCTCCGRGMGGRGMMDGGWYGGMDSGMVGCVPKSVACGSTSSLSVWRCCG